MIAKFKKKKKKVGIVVCENFLVDRTRAEELLTHELIHAFDHCRAEVDWSNCEHHACSEIRAASLSGDCRFGNEIRRGNFGFAKHHQECTKRRAALSVAVNPNCDAQKAKEAIEKVFEKCFADTAPFERMPF